MHIRKYDFNYSRRAFLEKTMKGAAAMTAAGVLAPLWPSVAESGDIGKAYPDELMSLDMYTKGKLKAGDVLSADNVEYVKDLLDPIVYRHVKEMGRKIHLVDTTRDVSKLFPAAYLEATLRNQGKAKLDENGNVVVASNGQPWIGGNPFIDPKTGLEAMANITLAWGRHDYSQYAIKDVEIGPDGNRSYSYDFVWVEMNCTARTDGTYWNNRPDLLRLNTVFFTAPNDTKGSSFLSTWYSDQRKFPDLIGYLPAFKRVRQFPTNQRFEPVVPGITFFLSDAWASGDPLLTWGNHKIVERKPMLMAMSGNWHGSDPNWDKPRTGGQKGQTFYESYYQLCPEVLVVESEPTGFPRAPVGKKRVWLDARNYMYGSCVTYDRRGEVWKSFETGSGQFVNGKTVLMEGSSPVWSWHYVLCHDIQANRMTQLLHAKSVIGGYNSRYSPAGEDVVNKFLTPQAIGRLGA